MNKIRYIYNLPLVIRLFQVFKFTTISLIYASLMAILYETISLLFWRMKFITFPFYLFKILKRVRGLYDDAVKLVLEITFLPSVENMYDVQSKWCGVLMVLLTINYLIYVKHTFSSRKHPVLLFLYTSILFTFMFLFYWDLILSRTLYPVIIDFWFNTLHLPSLLDLSPTLRDFVNTKLPFYFQEFREFIGCGKIYYNRPTLKTMGWEREAWIFKDVNNIYGLKGIHPSEMGWKVKCDTLNFIIPDLYSTYLYKNDNALFVKVYNLHHHRPYPFVSALDTSLLHSIFFYNIGLSLATIIFAIAILLTLLYSLNFFTSLSLKDSEKLSPYECGFDPIHSNARIKFDIIYWIIGILYLIFDLEIIFIFPLATILHNLTNPIALLAYLFFMIILTLGFIYEYKKGALKLNI